MIGLTSAFCEAGATNVVSSLWPVSDQATVMLMERYCRLVLLEKVAPPQALRQAALALRAFEVEDRGKTSDLSRRRASGRLSSLMAPSAKRQPDRPTR